VDSRFGREPVQILHSLKAVMDPVWVVLVEMETVALVMTLEAAVPAVFPFLLNGGG
jgi:hypothetical protein